MAFPASFNESNGTLSPPEGVPEELVSSISVWRTNTTMNYCKRPCHDCPFRNDSLPHMSDLVAQTNSMSLLIPENNILCHHSVKGLHSSNRSAHPLLKQENVLCAGALNMVQQLGLVKLQNPLISPAQNVCTSIEELRNRFARNPVVGYARWLALQPPQRIIRILKGEE